MRVTYVQSPPKVLKRHVLCYTPKTFEFEMVMEQEFWISAFI